MSKVSSGSGSSSTVRANENDPRSDFIMAWQKEFTTSFKAEEQFIFNSKEDITINTTGSKVQVASTNNFDGIGNNIGGNTGGAAESANEGIGDVISGIGDTIGNWFEGVVDWFKDGWATFKDWITVGILAVIAAGLIALAIYVGGVSAEKGEEEKAAGGVRRKLVTTTRERITKVITFDINNYVNSRVQKALFGENFKDIKQKEKEGKELSFREKIGKASDKIVHFDAIDRVINQGLQKVFLGVTSKRLNEEGYTHSKNPTGSKSDGSFRLNKSKERDFKSFKRGHTFNMIVKFDIFKGTNEMLQTAVLGKTFKELNDDLYKSQRFIDNYEEKVDDKDKDNEEEVVSTELMVLNQDVAIFNDEQQETQDDSSSIGYIEPSVTIVEVVEDAIWEIQGDDGEFYFYGEYAEMAAERDGADETDLIEGSSTLMIETAEESHEDGDILTLDTTEVLGIEEHSSIEQAEEVTETPAAEESMAEEVTEEQQEEMIETLETDDGETVIVDYDPSVEDFFNEEPEPDVADMYADAVELKEEMTAESAEETIIASENNSPDEAVITEVVMEVIEVMPETVEEVLEFFEGDYIDIEFTEVTEDTEQSEHQAEDFEEKSFADQQADDAPQETINESIVGDIDQDGIVDQTDAPDEEETDDEAEENEEVAEEVMDDSEDETEVFEEEQSEEFREEPTMVQQGPSEN